MNEFSISAVLVCFIDFITRTGVTNVRHNAASSTYILETQSGDCVEASKVVLATGAYLNISHLLAPFTDLQMDLTLTAQTVAFIRLAESEAEVCLGFVLLNYFLLCSLEVVYHAHIGYLIP